MNCHCGGCMKEFALARAAMSRVSNASTTISCSALATIRHGSERGEFGDRLHPLFLAVVLFEDSLSAGRVSQLAPAFNLRSMFS